MKIVLEFESLQDLENELTRWCKAKKTGNLEPIKVDPNGKAQKTAEDNADLAKVVEEQRGKNVVPFEKKAEPEPTPEPEPEHVQGDEIMPAPVPQVDESYRIEVRKTLAKLNKQTGENTASKLIKGFGVDKLTEVALKDLPELMRQAEEALNA